MLMLAALLMSPGSLAAKKVHTIGDSTMATYDPNSTDKRGWCQMLQQFFDGITVNNRGKSGASSKSFYKESAYWPTLNGGSDAIQSGDFVLIQFAHNDEKSNGTDGDEENAYHAAVGDGQTVDYRGTTPFGTFKEYLRKYIEDTKALGGKPILVGPICRKYFSGNTIRRNGRHDLGDNFNKLENGTLTTGNSLPASDHTMDYAWQMQQVAAEYDDVPYIDLTTATAELYLSYGESYCTSNLFCSADNTHPQALGATLIARTFAQLLKTQAEGGETDATKKAVLQELAQYVQVSSDISFNPSSGDLGKSYVGQQVVKEFNISAFSVTPDAGTFTITTDGDFYVSTDRENFSQSVSVDYTGGTLITSVYVKVAISNPGVTTGTLTVSNGTVSKSLDLSILGVDLSGGQDATVVFPLSADDNAVVTGDLTSLGETLSGMVVKQYSAITTWPEGSGIDPSTKVQLTCIDTQGSWPGGEIDEVSTRYVQFGAQVPDGKTADIDKISLYLTGQGGNGLCCKVYYATKADFSDAVLMKELKNMPNKSAQYVEVTPTISLEEGGRIYLRAYPWYNTNSDVTGKYLVLSNVAFHGITKNAGGVNISGTITYGLHEGGLHQEPVFSPEEIGAGIPSKQMSAGADIEVSGTTNWSGSDASVVMTKILNSSGANLASSATDGNTLTFTLIPDDGYYFMPSKVSFKAARFGTDTGNIGASIEAGTNSQTLCTSEPVNRGGKGLELASFSYDVNGVVGSADEPLKLKFSFIGLGNTKSMGLSDLVIEGTLTGSASQVTKYVLNTIVEPSGAGTIVLDPELASYKEGSTVTLTANKNFGYQFKEWQDGNGTTLSSDATTTVTMDGDKTMKAVFETVPVYTVSTIVTNDADRPLGSITLSPDEHEGKYEAGTTITATANESKILKFMQWTDEYENAGTTAVRSLTVNSDMTLAAFYEVQDFIAVFDASKVQSYAYSTTAAYPFAADITWDENRNAASSVVKVSDGSLVYTQDGGTPVVRNRENVVLSGINGLYQNGYNTTDIAFQYQFSTKGFTAATFTADMAAKNMASANWKALISTDGTNFETIGGATWSVTANSKKEIAFDLPESAMGLDLVYIRITGDGDEMLSDKYTFDGIFNGLSYCSHSESGVGNVYILGTAEVEEDSEAPVVTSTQPADNATGVSATGRITISFNERIKDGNIDTLPTLTGNGETKGLAPTWNSRSISFDYFALAYGATYQFHLPAGLAVDYSGNPAPAVDLTFTVMERTQPAPRTFDAIVDQTLEADVPATADMPAQYRKVQDAIDAAPSNSTRPYLIFIKEGYYNDPNTSFTSSYGTRYTNPGDATDDTTERIPGGQSQYDECRLVYVNKPNIHLIGQAVDKVTIAGDRLDGAMASDRTRVWYHVNAGATMEIQGGAKDFYMENITVDNENWTKAGLQGPQALAMNISADRTVVNNCNVRSYQDTYYNASKNNRQFWYNSTIEGSVDFIYGSADVFLESCKLNINRAKGGYIVAPSHEEGTRWGYVFKNTTITTDYAGDPSTYQVYFGRPWHNAPKTVFLDTQCEVGTYEGYWYETMGAIPAIFAVHNIWDKNGNKMSDYSRSEYWYWKDSSKTEKVTGTAKNSLTDEEAAEYTLQNVMAGDGSSNPETGVWNPLPVVEKTDAPAITAGDGSVTWGAVDYAICYVVTVNGKVVGFPTATSFSGLAVDDEVTVQSVSENGALSAVSNSVTITQSTGIVDMETMGGDELRPADGKYYNLNGQRVGRNYKGIIIVNGRKVVVR